eukprot:2731407-Prymnesium_polylepis.1
MKHHGTNKVTIHTSNFLSSVHALPRPAWFICLFTFSSITTLHGVESRRLDGVNAVNTVGGTWVGPR